VKDNSIKSLKKIIKGLLKRWDVSNKDVKAEDIKAVLEHRDKISYNSIIVKVKGFVKD
jgi:hypothetical protein